MAGSINAARHGTRIDLCVGNSGSSEGVMTCAIKALCGFVEGWLAPSDDAERARGEAAGLRLDTVLTAENRVSGDNTMFITTGVTDGGLVEGVQLLGSLICPSPWCCLAAPAPSAALSASKSPTAGSDRLTREWQE